MHVMSLERFEHFLREDVPLATFTWLRIGGPARYLARPNTLEELVGVVQAARGQGLPVRLLGGGSNLLVRDEGFPGLVVKLSGAAFGEIQVEGRRIIAGGGASLSHLVSAAVGAGLSGLEPLVGVPGTVGGALHGNAGTQDGDIGQWTAEATVLTRAGEVRTHQRGDMRFAYRHSSLDEFAILSATFELEPDDTSILTKRMQKLWIIQKSHQPGGTHGVGRIFKDPAGASAAQLIEQAGLKGASVGEAAIHDRRPNYIVTSPGASSQDVLQLIEMARSRVAEQLGVELETDIDIW